jgi:Family of unknown function (DUF6272)
MSALGFDFIKQYHKKFEGHQIFFEHVGFINQDITKEYSKKIEDKLTEEGADTKAIRKIFHAVVESLQNVMRHAHDRTTGEAQGSNTSEGSFIISGSSLQLMVCTCNAVPTEVTVRIKSMIDAFNALDEEQIKEEYKKMVKESQISEKGGAGLGLIDMIKKTNNKMEYHFEKINDTCSLVILSAFVNQN